MIASILFTSVLLSFLSPHYATVLDTSSHQTYLPLLSPSPRPPTTPGDFSLVIVSDVQYYFTICKDQPHDKCIFTNTRRRFREQALIDAGLRQVVCVNTLKNSLGDVQAVLNNGDVTNSATKQQLEDIKRDFDNPMKAHGLPFIVALGNHDYGMGRVGEGPVTMINYLIDEVLLLHSQMGITSIDIQRSALIPNGSGGFDRYTRGSLCFTFEIKDYVFIVMHWAPSVVKNGIFREKFENTNPTTGITDHIDVTSAETYFSDVLTSATAAGKQVVIIPHSRKGFEKFVVTAKFESLMESSNVAAVLAGHDHDNWGYYKTLTYGTRDVDAFYAGSVSYERLIVFNVNSANPSPGWKVTPYDTSIAGGCTATSDDNDDSK